MKNKKNNITSELSKENKILIILTLLAAIISITTGIVDLILGLESIMLWISFFSFTIVFLLMFTIAFRVIAGYTRTLQELEQVKHELQDINEKLVVVSETDELTGLCNRRHIMSLLKRLILLKEEEGFSLIMLDIDYFQAINNTHGHSVGDSVIKSVAKKLERNTRRSDTIGRIAGEEFLIILPNAPLEVAYQKAEYLRGLVEDIEWERPNLRVTISAGVYCKENGESLDDILEKADVQLNRAKSLGKNRVCKPE